MIKRRRRGVRGALNLFGATRLHGSLARPSQLVDLGLGAAQTYVLVITMHFPGSYLRTPWPRLHCSEESEAFYIS